jgi:LysM repeat protein
MNRLITGNSCAKGCVMYVVILLLIVAVSGSGLGSIVSRPAGGAGTQSDRPQAPTPIPAPTMTGTGTQANPSRVPGEPDLGTTPTVTPANPPPQTVPSTSTLREDISAQVSGPFYIVQPGDTLWGIALRFGTDVDALRATNNLEGNLIRPGQVLYLPQLAQQRP